MKTKIFSFVALVLFPLLSSSLILSASASTSSNNRLEERDEDASAVVDENEPVSITTGEYCKFLNAVALDIPLGFQAKLFLNPDLNRQPMRVPAGFALHVKSPHGFITRDDILE